MKRLMLALLLLPSISFAQEKSKDVCLTQKSTILEVEKHGMGSYIYYRLYDIDIGFENPVDVIIFTNGHEYAAAAFDKECFISYTIMNEERVKEFLESNLKKASAR